MPGATVGFGGWTRSVNNARVPARGASRDDRIRKTAESHSLDSETKIMTEAKLQHATQAPRFSMSRPMRFVLDRVSRQFEKSSTPFEIVFPDGASHTFGRGMPKFHVTLVNDRGVKAMASLDEGRFAEAYLDGCIDLSGDMLMPFALRAQMTDVHPATTAWRFIQPLLFGQVKTNRSAIAAHYDMEPSFFLSFLDPEVRCYTQGVYENSSESLAVATRRKFDAVIEQCKLKSGDRFLEIGPGWGGFAEHAHRRGLKMTGLTISKVSVDYITEISKRVGADWEIVFSDLLEYTTDRKFDAIVIMGVIEHLPNYEAVLNKFVSLLKPGGYIFLDGSAATKKYELSSFMVRYVYGGNHSFLVLHDLLDKLAKTPLKLVDCYNDRHSYFLTFQQWARNWEKNKDFIVSKFGDFHFRRFQLYLWGAAYEFLSRRLDCYRLVLHYPEGAVDPRA
jgi:cyclopropane-fatty-acyl-phospholipid synthase